MASSSFSGASCCSGNSRDGVLEHPVTSYGASSRNAVQEQFVGLVVGSDRGGDWNITGTFSGSKGHQLVREPAPIGRFQSKLFSRPFLTMVDVMTTLDTPTNTRHFNTTRPPHKPQDLCLFVFPSFVSKRIALMVPTSHKLRHCKLKHLLAYPRIGVRIHLNVCATFAEWLWCASDNLSHSQPR